MGFYKSTTVRKRRDGTTYKVRSRNGYGAFQHPTTKRRVHVCLGVPDKSAAAQILAKKIVDAKLDADGLGDRYREHERRNLVEHADDWHAVLVAKGRTRQHARQQRNYVRRIIRECDFRRWANITPDALIVWLGGTGLSIAFQNGHKQAFRQFCRWVSTSQRARPIDLSDVMRENAERDRRYKRRAFTVDECRRLLRVALDGPVVFGLTGQQRYRLYRVSLATGARPIELGKLQWHDSRLDCADPALVFDPRFTKNGRGAVVPLRGDMPALLRQWRAESGPGDASVLKTPSQTNFCRIFASDLATAGIPRRNVAGEAADFYCLRHTFGSMLAEAGTTPKELQELMRHANIETTMRYYIHVTDTRKAEAVDRLPDLSDANPTVLRMAAS